MSKDVWENNITQGERMKRAIAHWVSFMQAWGLQNSMFFRDDRLVAFFAKLQPAQVEDRLQEVSALYGRIRGIKDYNIPPEPNLDAMITNYHIAVSRCLQLIQALDLLNRRNGRESILIPSLQWKE